MPLALVTPETTPELPPEHVWLINPDTDKIITPLDDRGFVDIPQLVEEVKATIAPEHVWSGRIDRHHFQWPAVDYPRATSLDPRDSAYYFRELAINKGDVPREFHTWLHKITLPPPVPSAEAMAHRIEAWTIAASLFMNMQRSVVAERKRRHRHRYVEQNPDVLSELRRRQERLQDMNPRLLELRAKFGITVPSISLEDEIAQEVFDDMWNRHFGKIAGHIEDLEKIPPDFRLVEPDLPPREMLTILGKVIKRRAATPKDLGIMVERPKAA